MMIMIKIKRRSIKQAIVFFFLVSVAIHLSLTLFFVLTTGNYHALSFFSIVGLNLMFPGIEYGVLSTILSISVILTLFACLYFYISWKKPSESA